MQQILYNIYLGKGKGRESGPGDGVEADRQRQNHGVGEAGTEDRKRERLGTRGNRENWGLSIPLTCHPHLAVAGNGGRY